MIWFPNIFVDKFVCDGFHFKHRLPSSLIKIHLLLREKKIHLVNQIRN